MLRGGSATLSARARNAWERLPPGVRRTAHVVAQASASALLPLVVRLRWRRGRSGGGPLVIVGLYSSTIGLGQGARLFAEALERSGRAVWRLDVTAALGVAVNLDAGGAAGASAPPPGGVLITHLNPPELELWLKRGGLRTLRGRRHIGYWAWETPRIPKRWRRAFRYVDEVWCPSSFVAEALRGAAPPGVPVHVVAHPVHALPTALADRAGFGLEATACVVLVALDLRSTGARKNPQGALDAYLRAVPGPRDDVVLVCKVSGAAAEPAALEAVTRRARGRPDVRLLTKSLSATRMAALVASADLVLSLHRAEGFGLLLAEALWLGKAVVATGWSGNLDFMEADGSVLVPWRPTPIDDAQSLYAGGFWAEPDLAFAAERLAALIEDPAGRRSLAARGAAQAQVRFAEERWNAQMKERLTRCIVMSARDAPPPPPSAVPLPRDAGEDQERFDS